MVRSVAAVLAGLFVGFVVIASIQSANLMFISVPGDFGTMSHEQKRAVIDGLPVAAILLVLASYAAGPFVGAYVTAWLARRAPLAHGGVVGAVFLAATAANLVDIPHPLWFTLAAPPTVVLAAWLGARAGGPRPAAAR